ncbi:MAG: carbohydrate ABC transporter permease [Anaerolineae bacterium]|nr:carbohydrate ABC transporter permease [Anaerolineae bacterium]
MTAKDLSSSSLPRRQWRGEDFVNIIAYIILTLWALLALFPIYWMLKNSFEPNQLLNVWPPRILPNWERLSLDNYSALLARFPLPLWFFNSLLVALVRTIGAVFFGSLAGYTFAKLYFFGREVIFWTLMAVLMLPGFILIIPQYQIIRALDWYNTYWALLVPGITGGVWAMFLMRQFMRSLPTELIESARIDGAGEFAIFARVIAPLAAPGMAVLAIFQFIGNWNSFIWPLVVTSTKEMRTLPVGLGLLSSPKDTGQVTPIGEVMAGATIAALPMIIVFLFFQRYFLRGITIGAIKG